MMEAYGIVRIVFLYEPAQNIASRDPVPASGRHKGGVERFRRFGHVRVRGHDGKVRVGLVDLSGLEVHSAERRAQLAVRAAGHSRCRR